MDHLHVGSGGGWPRTPTRDAKRSGENILARSSRRRAVCMALRWRVWASAGALRGRGCRRLAGSRQPKTSARGQYPSSSAEKNSTDVFRDDARLPTEFAAEKVSSYELICRNAFFSIRASFPTICVGAFASTGLICALMFLP